MTSMYHNAIRHLPVLLTGLAMLCACLRADAAPTSASEAAVKAAYMFNIMKFTEWPPAAMSEDQSSLVICTDAEDELRVALEALKGKIVKQRKVIMRSIEERGLDGCHVALLDNPASTRHLGSELPVLTVTTRDHSDAMVRLFVEGRRLRFAVNLAAARRASIQFSAKLLSVAADVTE